MRGRIKLLFLLLLAVLMGRAQTISQYEYWLDADYGHRHTVATNSTAVEQSIDISRLSDGIHYLNFRAVDGDGVSGLYYRYLFMVPASEMTDATVSGSLSAACRRRTHLSALPPHHPAALPYHRRSGVCQSGRTVENSRSALQPFRLHSLLSA